ncbi:hypothetical protein AQUCO_00400810v1 [Aquilegia coerulea]|uniref:DNA/RNA-binding domain-containing protein n=1 Tax=Aquilegia coerulea TaxID=218851 RepID=A0A2G5EWZ8_AQUCA|nr:hypothetical protein AQUCO_00400810v1 [Aquilegia coerulea]PIA60178.1 hypothetical protein AQUCO_00400810v1 [Aquilegia coerulea]
MMTVPMDNLTAPSKELVQRLYKKNIELENKRRKSAQARIPSDPNAWQQMRENYEAIILEDHAFSEQHEIEYALWQLHYRRIEELRAHFSAALASSGSPIPGGKGPAPAKPDRIKKIRSQFKTFLSEATGFYHDLILKIRAKYGLPLGHFTEEPQNLNAIEKDGKKHSEVKKGLMSCHRCLIYLGDLARYKGLYGEGDSKTREYAAASSYYMQAASLWPTSGNPHHQLAILASYSGDDLGSIYRYFRSLAVSSPFTTARDNLIIAFEKNRQSYSQLPGDSKVSPVKAVPSRKIGKGRGKAEAVHQPEDSKLEAASTKESTPNIPEIYKAFCIRFVRLNGVLFTRTSLETFGEVFSLVSRDLQDLLSSGPEEALNFGTDAVENGLLIVRLVAIIIFTVHNVNREVEGQSYAEILQRSVLLQNAFTAAFEIMGHILRRSIQLHDPSSSYLLPGILVFVEWLACRPDIVVGSDVEEKQATARLYFWNQCILFLNKLMSSRFVSVTENGDETCFFNMSRYDEGETDNRLALWEDFELRGFIPLLPAQLILDFSRNHSGGGDSGNKEKRARVQRILAAGRALASAVQIDGKGVYFDQKLKKFIIGVEPQSSDEFILTGSYDMANSVGISEENPVVIRNAVLVQPTGMLYMEGEEEDEEIVFKPTISEKLGDVNAPKLTTYEVLAPGENISNGEWTTNAGPISAPLSSFGLQNVHDVKNKPLASFGMPAQNQQPIVSGASSWLVDQQAYLVNGVNNMSIVGNGFVTNAELKDGFGSSQPPAHSLPFSKSFNHAAESLFPDQIIGPEAVIPSKFDSIMSSYNADSMTLNASAALQASLRKNPVSRPVRHHGPPPGFSTVAPKHLDDVMVGPVFKDENPPVDDYSWLDGYQLSSSAKGMTPNNNMNHTAHMYPHVMNDNSSLTGAINFPFPGKQVPSMQVQDEGQKNWQDYQLLEQLKIYQEQQQQQQQQLQQANQQSARLPEQYQGQSLWSGRFFV